MFHVIGANHCPEAIARLNGTTIDGVVRIIVHGYVEDLKAFYGKMRVSVVPLRWGAGVKGKVMPCRLVSVFEHVLNHRFRGGGRLVPTRPSIQTPRRRLLRR